MVPRALRVNPIRYSGSFDELEHSHVLANHLAGDLLCHAAGRLPRRISAIAISIRGIFLSMVLDQKSRRHVLLLHKLGTMPGDHVGDRRHLRHESLLPGSTAGPTAHRRAPKISFARQVHPRALKSGARGRAFMFSDQADARDASGVPAALKRAATVSTTK